MQKLTERQQAVLEFIVESIQDRGYPPTLREIGNHLGIRSTNGVNDHLRALERKGYLTREDMKSRTLRPTEGVHRERHGSGATALATALDEADTIEIPILGRVAAGLPLEAIEAPTDSVRIDRMLLGASGEIYGLRIVGDSMIEAGIHDGDYVFVKKQLEARRGQIVVAMVGDEATCKYYFPEGHQVRLEPANATMKPILVPRSEWRETQILGIVVGMYRKM